MNSFFPNILWLTALAPVLLFILLDLIFRVFSFKKFFSKNAIGAISAGLLLSLAFVHFLPHSLEDNTPLAFSLTMLITLVSLLLIETHLIPRLNFFNSSFIQEESSPACSHYHQHHHHPFAHQSSFSAIGCLLICAFFDGVRLGSALLIDWATVGTAGVSAVFHIVPEGIAVMGLAKKSLSSRQCRIIQTIFCAALGAGIFITGFLSLKLPSNIILSLSTAAFLYVGFVHLLPVAFSKGNQKWFIGSVILSSGWLLFYEALF